jgi:hypothetical protein
MSTPTCDGCRCYARSESLYPRRYQFCGKMYPNGVVYPCPSRCCDGGCPAKGIPTDVEVVDVRKVYRKPPPFLKLLLLFLIVLSTIFMT